jgi:hypothetical protein
MAFGFLPLAIQDFMASSKAFGQIFQVSGSLSTKTGIAFW